MSDLRETIKTKKNFFFILLIAIAAAGMTWVSHIWIRNNLSNVPPPWDTAGYIFLGLQEYDALVHGGIASFVNIYLNQARSLAPLVPATAVPFFAIFGPDIQVAYLTNFLYLFILLLSVFFIGEKLSGFKTGLLATFIAATFPAVIAFSRDFLFEFPLAALTSLSYLFFLKSDSFSNRRYSVLFGIAAGLSLLTKTMGIVFFVFPICYAALIYLSRRTPRRSRRNILIGMGATVLVVSTYYLHNFMHIFGYLFFYGFGKGSANYSRGVQDIMSFRNWLFYAYGIAQRGISPGYALLVAVAIPFFFLRNGKIWRDSLLLILWFICGYLLLSVSTNKDTPRYALPILPPLAVIMAGGVMNISRKPARALLLAVTLAVGAINYTYQTQSHNCRFENVSILGTPVLTPVHLTCTVMTDWLRLPYDEWDILPLLKRIDSVAPRDADTVHVLMAVDHPFLNINSLSLFAKILKLRGHIQSDFDVKRITDLPPDQEEIATAVKESQFIIAKTGFQGPDFSNQNNYLMKRFLESAPLLGAFTLTDGSIVSLYRGGLIAGKELSQQEVFALPRETNDLDIGEQVITNDNGFIKINGWAAVRRLDSKNSIIYFVLKSRDKTYIFDNLQLYKRPDVTKYFKIDRDESGYNIVIPTDKLKKGEYRIGIMVKKNNSDHFHFTDWKLTV